MKMIFKMFLFIFLYMYFGFLMKVFANMVENEFISYLLYLTPYFLVLVLIWWYVRKFIRRVSRRKEV